MKRALLRIAPAVLLFSLVVAGGCAPIERKEFDDLAYRVASIERNQYAMKQALDRLEKQITASRRPQAEMVADLSTMRSQMATLRGQIEESAHRMNSSSSAALGTLQTEAAKREERLARLEKALGVTKDGRITKPPAPPTPPKPPAAKLPATAEGLYDSARDLYKRKQYEAARARFQVYLKKFPKHKYAGHANYWIGDTFYAKKDYENAILAYNQVIKRYRSSSKVPAALLKQGLAFIRLGDKRTAKIVLEKLVRGYPKTSAAKQAARYLQKL